MPVFALALGLSACGKSADNKPGGGVAPAAIAATGINTKFAAECGDAAAASSNVAFDLSQCQLSQNQLALLQGVGPFNVVADCVHQSVQIKNEAGEISGAGDIKPDGTYSVPLEIGERFSELDNCPVKLEGLATGKVACDDAKKVTKVDVNTTFTFSHVDGASAALALTTDQGAPTVTAATTATQVPPVGPGPGPIPGPVVGPVPPVVGPVPPVVGPVPPPARGPFRCRVKVVMKKVALSVKAVMQVRLARRFRAKACRSLSARKFRARVCRFPLAHRFRAKVCRFLVARRFQAKACQFLVARRCRVKADMPVLAALSETAILQTTSILA